MPVTTYTTTAATLPAYLIDTMTGRSIVYAVFDKAPAIGGLLIYENIHYKVVRVEQIEQNKTLALRIYVQTVEGSHVKFADQLQPASHRGRGFR